MSKDHQNGFAEKHPSSAKPDPVLADAVQGEIKNGTISCAAAHRIAKRLGRPPLDIGRTIDLMEIRMVRCQLGLFGYTPEKRIVTPADDWAPALEADIRAALQDSRLPCAAAWSIAGRHGLSRLEIGNVCEALGIKVRPCQLGAF